MKALVLGGNGFIGSHLVDRLLRNGHAVRVFDRGPERFRPPLSTVDYRFGDFSDFGAVAEALGGVDVVFHLISTTVPSTSNADPVGDIQGNLINTVHLLRTMQQEGVGRIVYLSSGGTVYGVPETVPIAENHPLRPICSYGVVKVAIEHYLQMFYHLHGLEYVVLRASNPFGERQGHVGVQGVIGTFLGKIMAGDTLDIWGDGSVIRDFIYVDDLADLCVLAGESNLVGIYNAGSGIGHSINDIVDAISVVTGQSVLPSYRAGRGYDVPTVVLDVDRAKSTFGWSCDTGLTEGIERAWQWMNIRESSVCRR